MDAIQRFLCGEDFLDVERLIYCTVKRFHLIHQGDFDEMFSTALMSFLKAHAKHDSDRAQFTTHLVWTIWRDLQEARRKQARRRAKLKQQFPRLESLATFHRFPFADELSEDAKVVIRLVFNMPTTLEIEAQKKGGNRQAKRNVIKEYLRGLEWSAERIRESFKEIQQALA